MLIRQAARREYEMRDINFIPHVSRVSDGSCVAKVGHTQVMCMAAFDKNIKGIVVEAGILPGATIPRQIRGVPSFQVLEIQAAVLENLKLAIDLDALTNIGLRIDCDVIQSEGSLQSAAISGAYVAAVLAFKKFIPFNVFPKAPLISQIAAISCGIVKGEIILDLDHEEALQADLVCDFVFNDDGQILNICLQGQRTGTTMNLIDKMAETSLYGARSILDAQRKALENA